MSCGNSLIGSALPFEAEGLFEQQSSVANAFSAFLPRLLRCLFYSNVRCPHVIQQRVEFFLLEQPITVHGMSVCNNLACVFPIPKSVRRYTEILGSLRDAQEVTELGQLMLSSDLSNHCLSLLNLTRLLGGRKSGGNAVSIKMAQNLNRSSPV